MRAGFVRADVGEGRHGGHEVDDGLGGEARDRGGAEVLQLDEECGATLTP